MRLLLGYEDSHLAKKPLDKLETGRGRRGRAES
jgi:hypothetical protein